MNEKELSKLNYTIFDLETTGMHPKEGDEIIEIGAVRMNSGKLSASKTFSSLVNPQKPVSYKVCLKNGIDSRMVQEAPTIEDILPEFIKFIGDSVLVAQNIAFDLSFLRYKMDEFELEKLCNPNLDTYQISRYLYPDKKFLNLEALAELTRINLEKGNSMRRMVAELINTARVFERFIELLADRQVLTLKDATDLGMGNF
ncbi:3'-5' exoribonuclease [bacterium]|nr:3'-5' exoribonuclease [bacterium]